MSKRKKILFGSTALVVFVVAASFFVAIRNRSYNVSLQKVPTPNVRGETTATNSIAKLEVFAQPVLVSTNGDNFKTGVSGQEVFVGYKIKTEKGGRAQIVYDNRSVTRIEENSTVIVERLEENGEFSASILVESGSVWSRVSKVLGSATYETKTPTTVATVRGTSYGHSVGTVTAGDTIISLRKAVAGKCKDNSQTSTVNENRKANFTCKKGVKPNIVILTKADLTDPWIKFNIDQDNSLDQKYGIETYNDKPAVLGATATPLASPKPTAEAGTPTPTPTPTPTENSTPTSTQTPDPTISRVSASDYCPTYTLTFVPCTTTVAVDGANFGSGAKFDLLYSDGTVYSGSPSSTSDTQIVTSFTALPCGDFKVTVYRTDGKQASTQASLTYPERPKCG